ncbi:MAG: hypothetical protein D6715_02535 [Calditrichaeota bacterium]|nr:MAG: hypothetical protein D6715_02535 [Calditrichota bacterium]
MKQLRYLWALLVLLLLAGAGSTATLKQTEVRRLSWAPGQTVKVYNVNGSIQVNGWDSTMVKVIAHKTIRAESGRAAEQIADSLKIQLSKKPEWLEIRLPGVKNRKSGFLSWLLGNDNSASVKLEVYLPRETSVYASTSNGRIELHQVRGRHRLKTSNGRITGKGVAGGIQAHTSNGRIEMSLVQVFPGESVELFTSNGKIEVFLPDSAQFKMVAKTSNGRIQTDFPLTTAVIESGTEVEGEVGNSRFNLVLKTSNGNIHVGHVAASAGGESLLDWFQLARNQIGQWLDQLRRVSGRDSLRQLLEQVLQGATQHLSQKLSPALGAQLLL